VIRRTLALSALAVVGLVAAAAPASATRWVAGAPGAGDPFFPNAGNGGYQVRHYGLAIEYEPADHSLSGRAAIFARATQNLKSFNLDLRPFLEVSRVTVNGRRASYTREGDHELVIQPRPKLRPGRPFVVTVRYAGTVEPIVDPDESLEGWVPTDDGAFVVNEPQGSPGWYPANDTPKDKATFDFAVTVPEGRTVMANGRLAAQFDHGGKSTWIWRERDPMATYLATATNGVFQTDFDDVASGNIPLYNAVDPTIRESSTDPPNPDLAWEGLARQPEIIDWLESVYGDYPFRAAGGIVDWAPDVGYALESQTKPNYAFIPDVGAIVHELSHQWFGDSISLKRWPDIWLNEGFATYTTWLWSEREGNGTAQEIFDETYATPEDSEEGQDLWFPAPNALEDPSQLFGTPVYDRGAMTLHALRGKIGDDVFFQLLRDWYAQNRDGNVTTADFIRLAERESGQQLDDFFQVWLYEEGKPASW
jgi:aminopeptidase N